jgi:hypothetical protein
MSEL